MTTLISGTGSIAQAIVEINGSLSSKEHVSSLAVTSHSTGSIVILAVKESVGRY